MIGFVTWPPFICQNYYKGGQMTKPIICTCEIYAFYKLNVIQGVENSFGKVTFWPQLISEFLVAHACMFAMLLLIGLAPFYAPGVLFNINSYYSVYLFYCLPFRIFRTMLHECTYSYTKNYLIKNVVNPFPPVQYCA